MDLLYKDKIYVNNVINFEKIFFIDDVQSYLTLNMKVDKISDDEYHIEFQHNISSNIHYYVLDGVYIYSFSEEHLAKYINSKGIKLSTNENFVDFMNCTGKRYDNSIKSNHYKQILRIMLYNDVTITKTGYKANYINDLFTIDLYDAYPIIQDWIQENTKLFMENSKNIIPDLSAGLDTRSLIYFYRDMPEINQVFSKLYEADELQIVNLITSRLGLSIIYKRPDNIIGVTGKGADIYAVDGRFMDKNYFENNICQFKHKYLAKFITPYLNKNLLRIKCHNIEEFKPTIQYLLVKDLLDIKYISFCHKKYIFNSYKLNIVKQVFDNWKISM